MIKFLMAHGIGFSPGSVKFMPTLGLGLGEAPSGTGSPLFDDTRTLLMGVTSTMGLAVHVGETDTADMAFAHTAQQQLRDL